MELGFTDRDNLKVSKKLGHFIILKINAKQMLAVSRKVQTLNEVLYICIKLLH